MIKIGEMSKEEFLEIFAKIPTDTNLEDIVVEHNGKRYSFDVDDLDWDHQGKYQFATDVGTLIEIESDGYKKIKRYNYEVSLSVTRSGGYFSDYYYQYGDLVPYEIKEVEIPEQIIPAYTEKKSVEIKR